jgi:hypothetical protein
MSCVPADGAMYLLPKIDMPKRAIEEAEKRGKKADVMYTLDLLGESLSFVSARMPVTSSHPRMVL